MINKFLLPLSFLVCLGLMSGCLFKEKVPIGNYYKIESTVAPEEDETVIAKKIITIYELEVIDDKSLMLSFTKAQWNLPSGMARFWFKKMANEGNAQSEGIQVYEDAIKRFYEGNIMDQTKPFLGGMTNLNYEKRINFRQTYPYNVKDGILTIELEGAQKPIATYQKKVMTLTLDPELIQKLFRSEMEEIKVVLELGSKETFLAATTQAMEKVNLEYSLKPDSKKFADKPLSNYLEKHRKNLQKEWEQAHSTYYSKVMDYLGRGSVHQNSPETVKLTLAGFEEEKNKSQARINAEAIEMGLVLEPVALPQGFPDLSRYATPAAAPAPTVPLPSLPSPKLEP